MSIRNWLTRFPNLITDLTTVVVLNFASGLLMILQAVLLARLVTDVFLNGFTISDLTGSLAALLVVIVLRSGASGFADRASSEVSMRVREDLRLRLVRHLFRLGPVFLRQERSGELQNAAMTGVEQIDVYVAKYLPQAAHAFMLPVAVWCIVAGTDIWAAVILAVTAPLIPLFMILIGKGAESVANRQWKALSLFGGHFLDVIRGLTTLKVFNRSHAQVEIIRRITADYRDATMRSLRVAFLSALVLELLTTLSTAVVAVMLGLRLIHGGIDFHRAFLILLLVPEFYQPIRMIGTQFHASMNGIEAAKRIFAVLDTEPVSKGGDVRILDEQVSISFEDVSFFYPGSTELVLDHVSFQVPVGRTVAVIGPSGSGKSSLFDLLLGFAQPTNGRILVNGVPLNELDLLAWRRMVSYVPQRTHLFVGTLRDNIRLARPEASHSAVSLAARMAYADEFVRRLPDGYDTEVGETLRLSGGEAQRIAMARALLKDTPVLCFDEPTAELDVASEHALQSALQNVIKAKTALIVAHRMQTVAQADEIVVIDSGRVVQAGTHKALLAKGGTYARMWHTLNQGDLDDGGALTRLAQVEREARE